jgi:hypothetical protein
VNDGGNREKGKEMIGSGLSFQPLPFYEQCQLSIGH